jgi:hypothetical protein
VAAFEVEHGLVRLHYFHVFIGHRWYFKERADLPVLIRVVLKLLRGELAIQSYFDLADIHIKLGRLFPRKGRRV